MKTRILTSLITVVALVPLVYSCNSSSEGTDVSKSDVASDMGGGKADGWDLCLLNEWYNDGECDTFCPEPDPDCGETVCRPICDAVGTRSEGWYDSCTNELIGWAQCSNCTALCQAVGSRSEGWYDSCGTGMDGTGLIRWERCGTQFECPLTGILCTPSCPPEEEINGAPCQRGLFNEATCTCEPIEEDCKPICDAIGSRSEGWYDSCSGDLIGWGSCGEDCEAVCRNVGTRSVGWYDSCDIGLNGIGLIVWDSCGEQGCPLSGIACSPDCPVSGEINGAPCQQGNFNEETCVCEPLETYCMPVCDAIGSNSEGWYQSCTGDLIGWAPCAGCVADCRNVGTPSEGWYDDSCGGLGFDELITYATCGLP